MKHTLNVMATVYLASGGKGSGQRVGNGESWGGVVCVCWGGGRRSGQVARGQGEGAAARGAAPGGGQTPSRESQPFTPNPPCATSPKPQAPSPGSQVVMRWKILRAPMTAWGRGGEGRGAGGAQARAPTPRKASECSGPAGCDVLTWARQSRRAPELSALHPPARARSKAPSKLRGTTPHWVSPRTPGSAGSGGARALAPRR